MVKKGLVEGIELKASDEVTVCESCESAKTERKSITKVQEGEQQPVVGNEIHSNLWGPAPVESINHKHYYISFTDDHSQYTVVYFEVKCLHSDQGGEYLSEGFSNHLKRKGTVRKLMVHDTPEHNGISERLNHTILEKVQAMLHESDLPKFLWAEAVVHAVMFLLFLHTC